MENFANFDNATILTPRAPVDEEGKPIERWAPLGANDSPDASVDENLSISEYSSSDKLRTITEEHELLNSSLLFLTSHIAQVQFRLEQVLQADPEEKEALLRDLEKFAWKDLPDLHGLRQKQSNLENSDSSLQAAQQKNLAFVIDQLKSQLNDLEQFAYKSGEIEQPPTQSVLEKQRVVLEELGKRLGLDVSAFPSLTEEEIRERVNAGLAQLTNPNKTNEALVDQLKTQIIDLERFIDFLHDEGTPDSAIGKALEAFRRYQEEQRSRTASTSQNEDFGEVEGNYEEGGCHIGLSRRRPTPQKTAGLITRALTILQVFVTLQLAGRRAKMHQQAEKYAKTATSRKNENQTGGNKMNHWGDIRARLEMAIEAVVERAERLRQVRQEHYRRLRKSSTSFTSISSDEETLPPIVECCTNNHRDPDCVRAERELNVIVRKHFCPALEALIEHGSRLSTSTGDYAIEGSKSSLLSSLLSLLGCFSRNRLVGLNYPKKFTDVNNDDDDEEEDDENNYNGKENVSGKATAYYIESEDERRARVLRKRNAQSSAWAIFLKYYVLTNGRAFNDTPARKLSESFALDLIGGKVVTAKQHLLSAMGTVLQEFTKYKRSDEAQFKALVCIGLNSHRLVSWLKLVLRSPLIVQYMYHPWSYVTSTGFDDALQSLNKLSSLDFDLPFDANIRHLQSINDVF